MIVTLYITLRIGIYVCNNRIFLVCSMCAQSKLGPSIVLTYILIYKNCFRNIYYSLSMSLSFFLGFVIVYTRGCRKGINFMELYIYMYNQIPTVKPILISDYFGIFRWTIQVQLSMKYPYKYWYIKPVNH